MIGINYVSVCSFNSLTNELVPETHVEIADGNMGTYLTYTSLMRVRGTEYALLIGKPTKVELFDIRFEFEGDQNIERFSFSGKDGDLNELSPTLTVGNKNKVFLTKGTSIKNSVQDADTKTILDALGSKLKIAASIQRFAQVATNKIRSSIRVAGTLSDHKSELGSALKIVEPVSPLHRPYKNAISSSATKDTSLKKIKDKAGNQRKSMTILMPKAFLMHAEGIAEVPESLENCSPIRNPRSPRTNKNSLKKFSSAHDLDRAELSSRSPSEQMQSSQVPESRSQHISSSEIFEVPVVYYFYKKETSPANIDVVAVRIGQESDNKKTLTSVKSKITTPRSDEKKTTDENGGTKRTSNTMMIEEGGTRLLQFPFPGRRNDISAVEGLDISGNVGIQEQASSEFESDKQIPIQSLHKPSLFKK